MNGNGSGMGTSVEAQLVGQAQEALSTLEGDWGPMVERSKALAVKDEPSRAVGVELMAAIAGVERRAEERRLYFTKPLNEIIRGINEAFKRRVASLLDAKAGLNGKLSAFQIEKERKAREAMAKQQEKIEKAIDRGQEIPKLRPVMEPPKTVQAPSGASVTMRSIWRHKIIGKVPEQFTMPDESKIGQFVRAMKGEAASEWLHVFEDKVASVR